MRRGLNVPAWVLLPQSRARVTPHCVPTSPDSLHCRPEFQSLPAHPSKNGECPLLGLDLPFSSRNGVATAHQASSFYANYEGVNYSCLLLLKRKIVIMCLLGATNM